MKRRKLIAQVLVAAMAITSVVSFSAEDANAAAAPKLSAKSKVIQVGKKVTLKVKKSSNVKKITKVTWKTSKKKVATVKKVNQISAKVTGKSVGNANISASVKYKLKTGKTVTKNLKCKIKVKKATVSKSQSTPTPTTTILLATAPATQTASPTPTPTSSPTATATITPTASPTPVPTVPAGATLKQLADFNVGTVISYDGKNSFQDPTFTELAKKEFDIVSFENEMKGYSLLDTEASQKSEDGTPVCTFEKADEMVQWAVDNGLKVRGHVLIWENSMASSFFYVDYDEEKELVDAETLKMRMQSYCKQVVTHFEEKFPGTVIAWDVVNEAIDAGGSKDETTQLYLYQTGKFYRILGGEYIKYAFQYAKEAVAAAKEINPNSEILLYYNDFNTFQAGKIDRILALIDYLNSDPNNKLLDCMGMEGYILTYWPNVSEIANALKKYAAKDVKIGVNELTLRLNVDQSKNKKEVTAQDILAHAKKYGDLFKVYCEFNKKYPGVLTNVSIWGLTDHPELEEEANKPQEERDYDYEIYGTHSGLFTKDYKTKDAYDNVMSVLAAYHQW